MIITFDKNKNVYYHHTIFSLSVTMETTWKQKNPAFHNYIIIYLLYMKVSLIMKLYNSFIFSIKLYKFNEIISGTPKKSKKEMGSLFIFGHFKNVQF